MRISRKVNLALIFIFSYNYLSGYILPTVFIPLVFGACYWTNVLFLFFTLVLCIYFKIPFSRELGIKKNQYLINVKFDFLYLILKQVFLIICLIGFLILFYFLSKYGIDFFTNYFYYKGFVFKRLGAFRYLEDLAYAFVLFSPKKFKKLLILMPHAIFIGHRSVLVNMTILNFLFYGSNYSRNIFKYLIKSIYNLKIEKKLLYQFSFLIILTLATLSANLLRGSFSSIIEFAIDLLRNYFPSGPVLQSVCIKPLSEEQTISLFNVIKNFFLFPINAYQKLWTYSPSEAINLYLNGLNINDFVGKEKEILGGITPGILAESFSLGNRYLGFIYIFLLSIALKYVFTIAAKEGPLTFITIVSLNFGFLYSPNYSLTISIWILLILVFFKSGIKLIFDKS